MEMRADWRLPVRIGVVRSGTVTNTGTPSTKARRATTTSDRTFYKSTAHRARESHSDRGLQTNSGDGQLLRHHWILSQYRVQYKLPGTSVRPPHFANIAAHALETVFVSVPGPTRFKIEALKYGRGACNGGCARPTG